MTTIRLVPLYVDHLWYPILVKVAGYYEIVEMQGIKVNEWNNMLRNQNEDHLQKHYLS